MHCLCVFLFLHAVCVNMLQSIFIAMYGRNRIAYLWKYFHWHEHIHLSVSLRFGYLCAGGGFAGSKCECGLRVWNQVCVYTALGVLVRVHLQTSACFHLGKNSIATA